ncbi:MAG: GNAT family N-acetyltransferase [Parvularculaceae bacterium]
MPRRPSPAVKVRRARPGDLAAVDLIEQRSFTADRFARATLRRLLAASSADGLIAEVAGPAAGYAIVLYRSGSTVARLYSIAVDPAARGQGVASALLAAAERAARARGCCVLRLEVRASNHSALSLYRRAGFTLLERKPGYYLDREDALRLEKRLGPCKQGGRSAY